MWSTLSFSLMNALWSLLLITQWNMWRYSQRLKIQELPFILAAVLYPSLVLIEYLYPLVSNIDTFVGFAWSSEFPAAALEALQSWILLYCYIFYANISRAFASSWTDVYKRLVPRCLLNAVNDAGTERRVIYLFSSDPVQTSSSLWCSKSTEGCLFLFV